MLKIGTYSAIIAPNKYYGSQHNDFDKSHETFRNSEQPPTHGPPFALAVMCNIHLGWWTQPASEKR